MEPAERTGTTGQTGQTENTAPTDNTGPIQPAFTAATTSTSVEPAMPTRQVPRRIIAAITELAETDWSLPSRGPAAPIRATTVLTVLTAVRDELERTTAVRNVNASPPQAVSQTADPSPNVLVIGVDGTNLNRVLADPANANFYELIQDSTTAAPSIAGHTTISNPSWTAILTGVWGETTGVINNVYNPAVYDRYPTVFNQFETLNPATETTAIADWDVIAAIAASGSRPADNVVYIPQVAGDTDWEQTDDAIGDAIGDATEAAIEGADPNVPNFIFTYCVGVDENGHSYGGASPQYAAAITNVDQNLGEILQVVNAWEAETGEQWTIIVVTDHGHQPQQGFGHGFQSPDETATFVIANNSDIFTAGAVNSQYEIVDVTPTVVTLFGGIPAAYSDGVSLTTLEDSTVVPVNGDEGLREALEDRIAANTYPDLATTLALSVRTIFASIPSYVDGYTTQASLRCRTSTVRWGSWRSCR